MIILGLTGGIASGKTTVSEIFLENNIPVICADVLAREVVNPGMPAYKKIVKNFGNEILNPDTSINRKVLADVVFNDKSKLEMLNNFIHPEVHLKMLELIKLHKDQNQALIVLDIPLLFESGLDGLCNHTVVVYAPEPTMKNRLQLRDNLNFSEIETRINSQMPIEEKKKKADFVIDNSSDLSKTKKQILNLLNKILCLKK